MLADLWFYYRVRLADTIAGHGPSPYEIRLLVQRLPTESLTSALMRGSRDYFELSREWRVLADIYDAIQLNTIASGNWKKGKQPAFKPYPRPDTEAEKAPPKQAVKSLFGMFLGGGKI